MTLKRKLQERIKGCNELQARFSTNKVVVKALEEAKAEYQSELDTEIANKAKSKKRKPAPKKK